MTSDQAKVLWEEILIHKTTKNAAKKMKLKQEHIKVFLAHTMPEMFVDKEISRINKLKLKELKSEDKRISNIIEKKQSSSIAITTGIIFYLIIMIPVMTLIATVVHIF